MRGPVDLEYCPLTTGPKRAKASRLPVVGPEIFTQHSLVYIHILLEVQPTNNEFDQCVSSSVISKHAVLFKGKSQWYVRMLFV